MPRLPPKHKTPHRPSRQQERRDQRTAEATGYRHWYWTQRWRKRAKHQLRIQPLCERCLKDGHVSAATIANHKVPHKGDPELFWFGELESSCKPHHDRDIQSEERTGVSKATGHDGWPTDPRHPANR